MFSTSTFRSLIAVVLAFLFLSWTPSFAVAGPSSKVQQYQALLKKPDMNIRIKAVKALGALGPQAMQAVPDLIRALAQEGAVMFAAYKALNSVIQNPVQVVGILKQCLAAKHKLVQTVCAQHLGRLLFEKSTLRPTHPQLFDLGVSMWGKQPGVLPWVWNAGLSNLASYYVKRNKPILTIRTLELAVIRGFDDTSLFTPGKHWQALYRSHPRFRKIIAAMKISPVDWYEHQWLQKELKRVQHETSILITKNIGRQDSQPTAIYTTRIPTRPTRSLAVLSGRWWLQWQQMMMRVMVHRADTNRRMHLMNMKIINSMGTRKSSQGYAGRMMALRSARMATQDAQRRLRNLRYHQFKPKAGLSTTLQQVPNVFVKRK